MTCEVGDGPYWSPLIWMPLGTFLNPLSWPASLSVSASCVPGRLSLASRLLPSGPSLFHGHTTH